MLERGDWEQSFKKHCGAHPTCHSFSYYASSFAQVLVACFDALLKVDGFRILARFSSKSSKMPSWARRPSYLYGYTNDCNCGFEVNAQFGSVNGFVGVRWALGRTRIGTWITKHTQNTLLELKTKKCDVNFDGWMGSFPLINKLADIMVAFNVNPLRQPNRPKECQSGRQSQTIFHDCG